MAEGGAPRPSYSDSDVNEVFLNNLMEMGIHREAARQVIVLSFTSQTRWSSSLLFFQALKSVNNRSLEEALAVVFGEPSFFPSSSATATSGATVEQATQVWNESVSALFY